MRNPIQKIAFVLPNFYAGGAERVLLTIANHLNRKHFQPLIIIFEDSGPLRDMVFSDIQIISLKSRRVGRGAFAFTRAIRKYRPDLIISTMVHLNMVVLLTKPFLQKTPVLVREAVTPSYFSNMPLKHALLMFGYYILYSFADRVLSPTKLVFDEMPGFLKSRPEKLQYVPNPVNTDFIHKNIDFGLRQNLVHTNQRLFVGAGRLVAQKGFDRLIDILRSWKERDDWRLVILGDGPDRQKLQDMIENKGLHQITLAGFESNPWHYFAAADAFLLPSRYEGLPNVALEALEMGTPVIAMSSAGGISEIAEQSLSGSVSIAHTMDEFLTMMNAVKPLEAAGPRKSLLPACFALANVVASYEQIFTESLQVKS